MNKKYSKILLVTMCLLVFSILIINFPLIKKEPVVITQYALMPYRTIDDLIRDSEVIVIGEAVTVLPGKWITPNGKIPIGASLQKIVDANLSIVTDTVVMVKKNIKGADGKHIIRVRSFIGDADQYRFVVDGEPKYEAGKTYLLFLFKDNGPTQVVDPGNFVSLSSIYGLLEVVDARVVGGGEEWLLEELISYIQKSLSTESPSPALSPVPTEFLIETLTPLPTAPTETPSPAVTFTGFPTETPTETVSPTP